MCRLVRFSADSVCGGGTRAISFDNRSVINKERRRTGKESSDKASQVGVIILTSRPMTRPHMIVIWGLDFDEPTWADLFIACVALGEKVGDERAAGRAPPPVQFAK